LWAPGQITLTAGKAEPVPSDYATAIRTRPVRMPGLAGLKPAGQVMVWVQLVPEPRLRWVEIVASRIDKATDDNGQNLTDASGAGAGRPYVVRSGAASSTEALVRIQLHRGEKEPRSLKELSGTVTARLLTEPRALMALDNVLKAANRAAQGKDGGALRVLDVKEDKDLITLRVEVSPPRNVVPEHMPYTQPAVRGAAGPQVSGPYNGLTLVDDKDKVLPAQFQVRHTVVAGALPKMEAIIRYRPETDKGMPARLVYTGRRTVTVEISYRLKDVALP
jgi:hypothetical protein